MGQALVLAGTAPVRFAVKQRLGEAGFSRVVMVRDALELWSLNPCERFDLVIVLGGTNPVNRLALIGVATRFDAPLLVAGDDPLETIEQVCRHPQTSLHQPHVTPPLRFAA